MVNMYIKCTIRTSVIDELTSLNTALMPDLK